MHPALLPPHGSHGSLSGSPDVNLKPYSVYLNNEGSHVQVEVYSLGSSINRAA